MVAQPYDHSYTIIIKFAQWFLRNLNLSPLEHVIDPIIHVEFTISTKNPNFVKYHLGTVLPSLVTIKWKYLIQKFHDICLSYYFNIKMKTSVSFSNKTYKLYEQQKLVHTTWNRQIPQ
jgi:hypothetical protein